MRRVGLLNPAPGNASRWLPYDSLAAAGARVRSLKTHQGYLAAAVAFAGGQAQGTPESLLNVRRRGGGGAAAGRRRAGGSGTARSHVVLCCCAACGAAPPAM